MGVEHNANTDGDGAGGGADVGVEAGVLGGVDGIVLKVVGEGEVVAVELKEQLSTRLSRGGIFKPSLKISEYKGRCWPNVRISLDQSLKAEYGTTEQLDRLSGS